MFKRYGRVKEQTNKQTDRQISYYFRKFCFWSLVVRLNFLALRPPSLAHTTFSLVTLIFLESASFLNVKNFNIRRSYGYWIKDINVKCYIKIQLLFFTVNIYPLYVNQSLKLVTTTPAKHLDGLNWNFQEIFLKVSSCASDKNLTCTANMLCYSRLR